jgi:nucleotide-binding universal stress UspA family protein
MTMLTLQAILHPTDFSPPAEAAFALACSLARDHGARLILLHVAPAPVMYLGGPVFVPPLPEEYQQEQLEKKLRDLESQATGVGVSHLLLWGEAVPEILRVAQGIPADLIAMGNHGRTGLARLLMGSVAEHVVRHAPCPVLTVKSLNAATSVASATAVPEQQRA